MTQGEDSVGVARRLAVLAPWSGVVFVVLFLAGIIVAGDPGTNDGTKIAAHFAEHRTSILVGMYLAALGLIALSVWVWLLREVLLRMGQDELAAGVLIAGVLVVAVEFPVVALDTGLAFVSDQRVDPGVARALHDLSSVFSDVDWFPLALLFAVLAVAVFRTGFLPSWLGWPAVAMVPLALIAAPPSFGLDVPVSLLTFLWIIVASVALVIRPITRREREQTT